MSLTARLVGVRPSAAARVPYVGRRGTGSLSLPLSQRGDRTEQLAAMSTVPTLFAVVHKLSTGVAAAEWELHREVRGTETPKPLDRHAALDLLRKPNPWMPWQEFAETTQQHIDLTGEGWWIVVRRDGARGVPLELWPVRPDRMEVDPDPTEFLSGYAYITPNGTRIPLGVNEVIQIRMPNPMDPYRGLGPVQALLVDLDSARYTAEWNRNFFRNSAEPGGVIEVESRLSDDEFDEMEYRWNEQHKGVANAHRVAILERAKWVDRKFTMRDMQFAELRKLTRDQVLEGFGFPKVMLGATDGVNMANAVTAEYMFSKWLVKTRLDRLKGAIDNDLLPMFGNTATGVQWCYKSPVPEDQATENATLKARVEAFKVLVDAGVRPESAAMVVGLPTMEMHAVPSVPNGVPEYNGRVQEGLSV